MQFKDVKPNDVIYILDRNNINIEKGNVVSVSFPHISGKPNTPTMVVDVTITINGETKQYEIKDSAESVYVGYTLFTPNIESVLTELRGLQKQSEDIVASIDKHKLNIDKCKELLSTIDPVFKKEQESEKRISQIETSIDKLNSLIEKLTIKIGTHE